jgi:hypothetical protein
MKTCPNPDCPDVQLYGVVGDYADRVNACPKCGTALEPRSGEPETLAPAEEVWARFERVAEISNPALIPIAKSLLACSGIRWTTRNDFTQNLIGGGQLGTGYNVAIGGVEFWVEHDAADDARELLSALGEAGPATG